MKITILKSATLLAMFALLVMAPDTGYAKRGKFLGNDTCKDCHKELFASWEKSDHAKVFDLLKPKIRAKQKTEVGLKPDVDYTDDKSCMDCHVSGVDHGGFSFDDPENAKWRGIGCEECHGAAENWIKLHDKVGLKKKKRKLKQAGMIKPFKGKTVCLRCHGNRNSPYKERAKNSDRDWTDMKWTSTYHILPEPERK